MSKEHPNFTRPVPSEPHWDISGRVGHIYSTLPKPGGPRLAGQLERLNGYIRGSRADVLYRALKPYLDAKHSNRDVKVDDGSVVRNCALETPISGEGRNFRPDQSKF